MPCECVRSKLIINFPCPRLVLPFPLHLILHPGRNAYTRSYRKQLCDGRSGFVTEVRLYSVSTSDVEIAKCMQCVWRALRARVREGGVCCSCLIGRCLHLCVLLCALLVVQKKRVDREWEFCGAALSFP